MAALCTPNDRGINPPEESRNSYSAGAGVARDAMPECMATATWYGSLMDGNGEVSLGSDVWGGEYATPGVADATNPEELLAAGHAGCFAMTAAYLLDDAGYEVEDVTANGAVTLEQTDQGFDIPTIELTVAGEVPDATVEEFEAIVEQAESACPVSNALEGTDIEVSVTLG